MNQIGIIGHRGSGKTTIAYLLGVVVDTLMRVARSSTRSETQRRISTNTTRACARTSFDDAIHDVLLSIDDTFISSRELSFVYFCRFCDIIYQQVSLLLGIAPDDIVAMRDTHIVNMRTFDVIENDNTHTLFNARRFFESRHDDSPMTTDEYMTLREFITYTCTYVMKRHFGGNVFVKMNTQNEREIETFYESSMMTSNAVKIWVDVKTSCEYDYLRSRDARIIRVERATRSKSGDVDPSFVDDASTTYDYDVTFDDVNDTFDKLYEIANDIVLKTFDDAHT